MIKVSRAKKSPETLEQLNKRYDEIYNVIDGWCLANRIAENKDFEPRYTTNGKIKIIRKIKYARGTTETTSFVYIEPRLDEIKVEAMSRDFASIYEDKIFEQFLHITAYEDHYEDHSWGTNSPIWIFKVKNETQLLTLLECLRGYFFE